MTTQEPSGRRGCSTALVFCLFLVTLLCAVVPAHGQTNISTPAYQLINKRALADQGNFYVYLDQDSGFNHGFPSGFMGTDESTISLNSGCIDSASSSTGCSTDPAVLDQVHGTVMSITFAAQSSGNWAGLAIEEPQEWLGLQYGNGYNLTGATSISFQVRSPNGAQVQYGVGGCMTPFTAPISSTWTTITLELNSTSLSCTPDLSDTHLLFEVVTNNAHDPAGATVLLDNIQFTPIPTAQVSALSFPVANETFGVVPQALAPIPSDQVLRNTTTIYESSLAEFVLLVRGTAQDLQSAKLIADTFDYALHHESNGDPIPIATGGDAGLHNGYESGDIGLYNNQPSPLLGLAGNVRLAGFTDTTLCDPSGYCLVLDGATGGNNAFAIIALVDAYRQFGNANYLNDALTIGNWIIANLTDTTGTGYGGYYVGYGDEGISPPKPIETGKSVENNADIFGAFTALANVETRLGNTSAAAAWTTAANVAGDFVMQMWDPVHGRFNVGTSPAGSTADFGTCPTGPQKGTEVINVCDFLDSNTFTTLPMAAAPRYQNQIDWRLPIQYALNTFAQSVTAAGMTYDGFDLVATPDSGANGVAWEFTGQMVESMNYVDQLYNVTTFQSAANTYLEQIAQAQSSAPFKDGYGLPASTLQGGDTLTPVNQCLSTPYQCIAERVGLAATSWGILAEQKLNFYNPVPSFVISGTSVTISAPGVTTENTSTITVTPSGGFIGSVALTAAITSSPHGAVDPPSLSFGSTTPAAISSTTPVTATLTIATTAATSTTLVRPKRAGVPWCAAGSATLACLLLFGIPAQRRRWRTILGIFAVLVALTGGVFACGGNGSSDGDTSNPGTTRGTYTITVTGTSGTITTTNTITLTVQ
jgi:hypothetical protein